MGLSRFSWTLSSSERYSLSLIISTLRATAGSGADVRDRTADLLITNQPLYQLSYVGI